MTINDSSFELVRASLRRIVRPALVIAGLAIAHVDLRGAEPPVDPAEAVRKLEAGYRGSRAFDVRIFRRTTTLYFPDASQKSALDRGTIHEELSFVGRPPQDMQVVSVEGRGVGPRVEVSSGVVMSRVGEKPARLFRFKPSTKGYTEERLPSASFMWGSIGRSRILVDDPVASQLASNRGARTVSNFWAARRGWSFSKDEGGGSSDLARLDNVTAHAGFLASMWVDLENAKIARLRTIDTSRGSPGRGPVTVSVSETHYEYGPPERITDAAFDPFKGVNSAMAADLSSDRFLSLEALVDWTHDMMFVRAREGVLDGPGDRAASTPAAPPVKPVEVQSLNADQMAAIVLIEGEGGAGTGFVTKLRDLPFVVTNLHVIGGEEKLRVTTLSGAKIETGPVHGAVGRDLAILRIEGTPPAAWLKLAENPLKTAKIGDKVVVVGNRRGGGVATQVSGLVQGIGPEKIEVDAAFQPGNSGSPIVHVETGEVLGLAAYSHTRRLDALDGPASQGSRPKGGDESKTEQRWFGYRIDGVASWEAIDLARWREQSRRIDAFRTDSEALYHALTGNFAKARASAMVGRVVDRFEPRFERADTRQVQTVQDVVEYFRSLRALTETGRKELRDGDYYDYFRSSLYWETSIPEQLRARERMTEYLDRATENSGAFLARLRN